MYICATKSPSGFRDSYNNSTKQFLIMKYSSAKQTVLGELEFVVEMKFRDDERGRLNFTYRAETIRFF